MTKSSTFSEKTKCKGSKAKHYKYCLAVLNSVVKNVYKIAGWQEDHKGRQGRYEFCGVEAPKEVRTLFVNKRIPEKYRKKGMASPMLYGGK